VRQEVVDGTPAAARRWRQIEVVIEEVLGLVKLNIEEQEEEVGWKIAILTIHGQGSRE
jgi:hypothetical protein